MRNIVHRIGIQMSTLLSGWDLSVNKMNGSGWRY